MLSSDVLEKQFGPTELRILQQTNKYRIIQTIAVNTKMVLELSFVTFDRINVFPAVHQLILDGGSIGKVYKEAGIFFYRDVRSISTSPVSNILKRFFELSQVLTIVEVSIFVGPEKSHYCDIIEIYAQSVEWPQPVTTTDSDASNRLKEILTLL
ncbi:hypothetical protein BH10PAT4_BH10PAT4_0750 [soil metagenome]